VNWEAISAIDQIVGALAAVVSLIYLAREIGRVEHPSEFLAAKCYKGQKL
jgi:hypothetical protein